MRYYDFLWACLIIIAFFNENTLAPFKNNLVTDGSASIDEEQNIPGRSSNVKSDLIVSPETDKVRFGKDGVPKFNEKFFKTKPITATAKSEILLNIKQNLNGTKNAKQLVENIEELLKIPPNTFHDIRIVGNSIVFNVDPKYQKNAEEIVDNIENDRDLIGEKLGVDILSVFEQSQYTSDVIITTSRNKNSQESYLAPLAIVLSSLAALALFLFVVLFVCRFRRNGGKKYKHCEDGAREKTGAKKTDHDASQHYQELCRSRMANKRCEKGDSPLKERSTRVQGIGRDSDASVNSPTSRSSTSSWSEEPAISNMDISTGHMVLSYMEDHLNNKDKLDKEWKALEKYEAEPSTASVAALPANKSKIRPNAQPPYDHNRVVLNPVTNAEGGDFINASTLTDHDPRNPAYITTQGVLAETVNDFWQMVWEQGCVVIVMLTRLAESGTAMCCRYWPEEGSEVYHIYEVHLVSEHIWCDEYLVRSFYLKNRKTAETRTVTQFHFLSWPDLSVPSSVKAFLEFRRKVNKSYRGRSCPMIVQCCDGAGRTGTYCLIDMVLNRMAKGVKEIDLTATLEHVRDQRSSAVGTRQQFEFVLTAIAEEVHAIIKTVPQ